MIKSIDKENKLLCIVCSKKESYCGGLCRKCYYSDYYKQYYQNNKKKMIDGQKKRYYENREECLKGMKEYAKKNKEKLKKYYGQYYLKNYDKMRTNGKTYYEQNKKELNNIQHLRKKQKRLDDPTFRLEENLRCRMTGAIMKQKGEKSLTTKQLLSAPISIVRDHLEQQFKPNMTWNNHGITGWHIDHIIPCSSFDLTKEEEQKKCFHYTNLQPLWFDENLAKGTNI